MPHYADGTPAKHGDLIIKSESYENSLEVFGILIQIQPKAETCNGQALILALRQKDTGAQWTPAPMGNLWVVTLKDCKKVE